ncbi:putative GPI-anchored protein [Vitis vinifera]|uniref:Putative GPI-anchored protein n=1 Tax=Vitis vinifera TaxID=29760 RepID=A0A438KCU9_VITVI|nr:putative GPI-anchored protein [Vitis vinifera]
MASLLQLSTLSFFLVALSILFTSTPVHCDAEDDDLLQGLNSYRTARNLSTLVKNDKAECLAEELAGELEHQPCTAAVPATPQLQLANYPSILKKCKIDINYTRDGVIMQVCVPHRVPTSSSPTSPSLTTPGTSTTASSRASASGQRTTGWWPSSAPMASRGASVGLPGLPWSWV